MTSRYGRAWLAIVSLAVVACSPGTDQQAAAAGASAGNGNRPQPSLSIAGVSADEGDSGATPFNFRVALSAATDDTVRVRYRTEAGSATAVRVTPVESRPPRGPPAPAERACAA